MKPILLNNIPKSESFEELRFNAEGDCTWVKFQDSEYIDWIGVFGKGWNDGGEDVIPINYGIAFILSNGQGYIVDVNNRKLLGKTECDSAGSTVIATTDIEIHIYDSNHLLFSTKRIASDGIKLKSCRNATVTGEVWGFDKWYPFTLDIKNQQYRCIWSYNW